MKTERLRVITRGQANYARARPMEEGGGREADNEKAGTGRGTVSRNWETRGLIVRIGDGKTGGGGGGGGEVGREPGGA
jgi:hypothetical protein